MLLFMVITKSLQILNHCFWIQWKIIFRYMCHFCPRSYRHLGSLVTHIQNHFKPQKCGICKTEFDSRIELDAHKKLHRRSGALNKHVEKTRQITPQKKKLVSQPKVPLIKSYKCDECDRKFAKMEGLTMHKLVHTNEQPFKCELCERR